MNESFWFPLQIILLIDYTRSGLNFKKPLTKDWNQPLLNNDRMRVVIGLSAVNHSARSSIIDFFIHNLNKNYNDTASQLIAKHQLTVTKPGLNGTWSN